MTSNVYNFQKDYSRQLKQLAFDHTIAEEYDGLNFRDNHVLVKLFYFKPIVEKESPIMLPKVNVGKAVVDLTKTESATVQKYSHCTDVVKILGWGNITESAATDITEQDFETYPLFTVRSDEVRGVIRNPQFTFEQQFATANDAKGTSLLRTDTSEYIPAFASNWKKYIYENPLVPSDFNEEGTVDLPFVYLIPINKIKSWITKFKYTDVTD